jgi:uncharacterized protein YjiS (DUF1127 family)
MRALQLCHAVSTACFAHAAKLSASHGSKMPPLQADMKRITAMAAYETTRTAPFGAISTYRFIQFFSTLATAVAGWNDARITRKALDKLSDRELDDIGLCRGDIDQIAPRF